MGAGTGVGAGAGARTGAGAGARTGAGARIQTSRTVLKIRCKSSSEYLGILVAAARALAMGCFVPKGSADWSDNLSSDSGGREESGGATEGAVDERLRRGRPRP